MATAMTAVSDESWERRSAVTDDTGVFFTRLALARGDCGGARCPADFLLRHCSPWHPGRLLNLKTARGSGSRSPGTRGRRCCPLAFGRWHRPCPARQQQYQRLRQRLDQLDSLMQGKGQDSTRWTGQGLALKDRSLLCRTAWSVKWLWCSCASPRADPCSKGTPTCTRLCGTSRCSWRRRRS